MKIKKMGLFLALAMAFPLLAIACTQPSEGSENGGEQDRFEVTSDILTLNKAFMKMSKGDIAVLNYYIIGSGEVVFSSLNESVATVSQNGEVTAIGVGETYVEARVGDVKKYCKVTVTEAVYDVLLDCEKNMTMTIGAIKAIRASVTKNGIPVEETVTFTLEGNAGTIVIENNVVTFKATAKGTATLKATIQGVEAICVINVKAVEDFVV